MVVKGRESKVLVFLEGDLDSAVFVMEKDSYESEEALTFSFVELSSESN